MNEVIIFVIVALILLFNLMYQDYKCLSNVCHYSTDYCFDQFQKCEDKMAWYIFTIMLPYSWFVVFYLSIKGG